MISVSVKVKGPLLEGRAAGMVKTHLIRPTIQDVIEAGEQRLDELFRPRPAGVFLSVGEAGRKASKGHYRRSVHGEVRHDTLGVLDDSGVVYGPWLEGTSSRNQSTRFKGYQSFRKTKQHLEKNVVPKVLKKRTAAFIRKVG